MSNEIYVKLRERMNQFTVKVPPVDASLKLFAEIYSEEEAETAINFPHGTFTMEELSDVLNKDKSELLPLIETMADKGQVFVYKTADGEKKYELAPWLPGVIEFAIIKRLDDPEAYQRITVLNAEVHQEAQKLAEPLMADMEAFKASLPDPYLRTIPIEQGLPENREVYSYESIMEIVEKEQSFAAMKCVCRSGASLRDEPCSIDVLPEHSCLTFGKVADYVADYGFGKRITKKDCIDIIKTASEAGAVHNSNNFTEGVQMICNCCTCCCPNLKGIKTVGNLNLLEPSNFLAVVDEDACTACGECEERCPVEAISFDDDMAIVNSDTCIGCGNCITVCPSEALTLERQADKKPVIGDKIVGLGY